MLVVVALGRRVGQQTTALAGEACDLEIDRFLEGRRGPRSRSSHGPSSARTWRSTRVAQQHEQSRCRAISAVKRDAVERMEHVVRARLPDEALRDRRASAAAVRWGKWERYQRGPRGVQVVISSADSSGSSAPWDRAAAPRGGLAGRGTTLWSLPASSRSRRSRAAAATGSSRSAPSADARARRRARGNRTSTPTCQLTPAGTSSTRSFVTGDVEHRHGTVRQGDVRLVAGTAAAATISARRTIAAWGDRCHRPAGMQRGEHPQRELHPLRGATSSASPPGQIAPVAYDWYLANSIGLCAAASRLVSASHSP